MKENLPKILLLIVILGIGVFIGNSLTPVTDNEELKRQERKLTLEIDSLKTTIAKRDSGIAEHERIDGVKVESQKRLIREINALKDSLSVRQARIDSMTNDELRTKAIRRYEKPTNHPTDSL